MDDRRAPGGFECMMHDSIFCDCDRPMYHQIKATLAHGLHIHRLHVHICRLAAENSDQKSQSAKCTNKKLKIALSLESKKTEKYLKRFAVASLLIFCLLRHPLGFVICHAVPRELNSWRASQNGPKRTHKCQHDNRYALYWTGCVWVSVESCCCGRGSFTSGNWCKQKEQQQ